MFTDEGYTIKKNQNVQVYSPNLYVETSYVSYVNYSLVDTAIANTVTVDSKTGDSWKVVLGDTTYVLGVRSGEEEGMEDTLILYQDGGDESSGKVATISEQSSDGDTVEGYFDDVSIGQSTYKLHFVVNLNISGENPEIYKIVFRYYQNGTFEIQ